MEKRLYLEPEMEVVEINNKSAILMMSGGGIGDNGQATTGEGGSENPTEDYGW